MLVLYFLRRLTVSFLAFLFILTCVLSFGDILVRLTLLPSLASIPRIVMLMLPLISVLAIPLASCLATSVTLGKLYSDNEIVMVTYLDDAKKSFVKAVGIFSFLLVIPYSLIVFEWAPKNYFQGKQFIVSLAKDKLGQLESGVFHNLMSRGILYFKSKRFEKDKVYYEHVLLVYKDPKSDAKYVITAKEGVLEGENLTFINGTMETKSSDKNYVASFQTTDVDIDRVFHTDSQESVETREVKFLTFKDLLKLKDDNRMALIELHSRFSQIAWQFVLPFMALLGVLFWGILGTNNLFISILSGSASFLSSYVGIGVAKSFSKGSDTMLLIFYLIPLALLLLFYFRRLGRSLL